MKVVWLLSIAFWGWASVSLARTGPEVWREEHDRLIAGIYVVLGAIATMTCAGSVALLCGWSP